VTKRRPIAVRVAVWEFGADNVRSVVLACERLGADVAATSDPEMVARADLAVLPGVRSARSAMPSRAELPRRAAFPGAMPLPRLIPCLDVAGDRVVKGVGFRSLREVGDLVRGRTC
jgi:hypothetical protein